MSTVAAANALLDGAHVDVLLVDLGLPDGHGSRVVRHAVARHPGCDVIVVTMFGDDANVTDCIAAGAAGYLLKDALPQVAAILEVRNGGSPISPRSRGGFFSVWLRRTCLPRLHRRRRRSLRPRRCCPNA